MGIFKKYTSTELLGKFKTCCVRFPLTLMFFLCLTVMSITFIHHDKGFSEQFMFFWLYYPATAAFLSFSLHLWTEEMRSVRRRWIIMILIHVLWLLNTIYLTNLFPFDINHGIACTSSTVLILISIFLLSFYRQKDDIEIWNFTFRIILSYLIAILVCVILSGGINLLFLSFQKLFGIHISYKVYIDVWTLCEFLLAPVLFLSLVPQGAGKHDKNALRLTRFANGVIHYLFIPLLASYLIVLYVYALKIIITWTLPCGWVSWLVSVLVLSMVIIITLLYPTQFSGTKRFDKFLMRYLPLMVLPLLLLMTAGVVRRVGDYGITIWRLYLIAFNIWCYVVCILLFITRSRRIWWIPASFAVIFFLLSTGPQSMANITKTSLIKEVSKMMDKSGVKHRPMNNKDYETCIAKLDTLSAHRLDDKLDYLKSIDNGSSLKQLIDSTVTVGEIAFIKQDNGTTFSNNAKLFSEPMSIPEGYSKVIRATEDFAIYEKDIKRGIIPVSISYEISGKRRWTRFELSLQKAKELSMQLANSTWILKNKEAQLYVDTFFIGTDPDNRNGNISGILFLK